MEDREGGKGERREGKKGEGHREREREEGKVTGGQSFNPKESEEGRQWGLVVGGERAVRRRWVSGGEKEEGRNYTMNECSNE